MRKLVLFIIVVSSIIIIYGCTGKDIVSDVKKQNNDMQSRLDHQQKLIQEKHQNI